MTSQAISGFIFGLLIGGVGTCVLMLIVWVCLLRLRAKSLHERRQEWARQNYRRERARHGQLKWGR